MASNNCKLLIIYGSQTGQSKSIAEDIQSKADILNYDTEILTMDESVKKVYNTYVFRILLFLNLNKGVILF